MNAVVAYNAYSNLERIEGYYTSIRHPDNQTWERNSRRQYENGTCVLSVRREFTFVGKAGVNDSFKGTQFVGTLPSDKLLLRSPLPAVIYKTPSNYFAYSQDADVYGMGIDADEAIEDLKAMVVELWYDLNEEKAQLGPLPAKQLSALQQLIIET